MSVSQIESISGSSYLARICFTLVKKLLPSLSWNKACLFARRINFLLPDLIHENNKLKCFFYLVQPLKVTPLIKEELQHLRFCLGEPVVYVMYLDGNHIVVLNVSSI